MDSLPQVIPPNNVELEKAVLGCVLATPTMLDRVIEKLYPDDFFDERNKIIYSAIVAINESGYSVDTLTVSDYIESRKLSGKFHNKVSEYLAGLMSNIPTFSNLMDYVKKIIEKFTLRSLHNTVLDIDQKISKGISPLPILNGMNNDYLRLAQRLNSSIKSVEIKDGIIEILQEIDAVSSNKGHSTISTGYPSLDKVLNGGLEFGDVYLIAARPGMGKTAIGCNIAYNIQKSDTPVLIFECEMTKRKLQYRFISLESTVSMVDMTTGHLYKDDFNKIINACKVVSESKIYIDDTPGLTIETIRTRSLAYKSKYSIGAIVIDHIQLVGVEKNVGNRNNELDYITRKIKELAKELNIPIVALSQLSRENEKRDNKRPQLSDLRDSGAIEQNVDVIAFLYREGYYTHNENDNLTTEIFIAKNRNGIMGKSVYLHTQLWIYKFEEMNDGFTPYKKFDDYIKEVDNDDEDTGDGKRNIPDLYNGKYS